MSIEPLSRMFHPAAIAVVGPFDAPGSAARIVLQNLTRGGWQGPIYPVDGTARVVQQRETVPSLAQIPGPVDLVVAAVPLGAAVDLMEDCSRIGAAGMVLISAGGNTGGGADSHLLASRLREAACRSGIRLIGPTSLGIINTIGGLNASTVQKPPLGGRLAMVSQSGALLSTMIHGSLEKGIGFSYAIGLGAMLDVDVGEVIDYLGGASGVGSIAFYADHLTRPRRFMSAARSVGRIKPIIALKAGRNRTKASAIQPAAGGDDACNAAFERAGILRVDTFDALFDAAEMLSRKSRYRGQGLAIVTNAGGPGVMAIDALTRSGLEPARLTSDTRQDLARILLGGRRGENPLDILSDATPARYITAISILRRDASVKALLVILAPQALTDAGGVTDALVAMAHGLPIPLIACWMGGREMETDRERLRQAGIPTFDTPERAVRAFVILHRHDRVAELSQQVPPRLSTRIRVDRNQAADLIDRGLGQPGGRLTEPAAKVLATAYGIPVNPTAVARSADEAVAAARKFGFPVVMKGITRKRVHKSDIGGVLLDLQTEAAVRTGFETLMARKATAGEAIAIDGASVEPMVVRPDYELVVGVNTDAVFGPVIHLGLGGIMTDLVKDRAFALPPLNRLLSRRLMEATCAGALFDGYRGLPPADREQLEALLIRISQMVTDFPQLVELEFNPLLVKNGVPIAVDAHARLVAVDGKAPLHLVVSPYPAEFESWVTLPLVGALHVRPIRPDDAELLLALFDTLSPRSVYYRFFSPMKQLSPAMLARFTQIDYDREIALVAIRESEAATTMLGAARVILQHNLADAEFSVLVGDPWQGQGIGARLLQSCIDIARDRHIRKIWGVVLAENRGMLALGDKLGFDIRRAAESGEYQLSLDLTATPIVSPVCATAP